jgi:DNA-binding response OmpR family regulator
LTGEGYQVISCNTGQEAFDRITHDLPDAVILDLLLPGMEGTELVLKLKGDRQVRSLPIVAMTGVEVGMAKRQILKSFSIPLVTKPWDLSELLDRVEEGFASVAADGREAEAHDAGRQGSDNG